MSANILFEHVNVSKTDLCALQSDFLPVVVLMSERPMILVNQSMTFNPSNTVMDRSEAGCIECSLKKLI